MTQGAILTGLIFLLEGYIRWKELMYRTCLILSDMIHVIDPPPQTTRERQATNFCTFQQTLHHFDLDFTLLFCNTRAF